MTFFGKKGEIGPIYASIILAQHPIYALIQEMRLRFSLSGSPDASRSIA
jgi:hypothetical protein